MSHIGLLGSNSEERFPPSYTAMTDPNGLLAIGGDLSPRRLLLAYRRGIFPWYDNDQPILWWTPNPRMVLYPKEVHCSRSMEKFLRKTHWTVTINCRFKEVIQGCAGTRPYSEGTWINKDMEEAYIELHKLGYAHSIEVNNADKLVGGLYGVSLGRVFYGESMFSAETNGSKTALIVLSRWLDQKKFALIDCQVANPHLHSLGAREIPRSDFEQLLRLNTSDALINSNQAIWQLAREQTIFRNGHLNP